MNNLDIYDVLRLAHSHIKDILNDENIKMPEFKRMAIETVSGVFYMAEGIFCKDGDLNDD